jgi:hypothetical protein
VPSFGREPTRVRSERRFIDLHRWGSGRSSSRRAQAPHGPRPGSAGTRPSLTRDEPRAWAGVGSAKMGAPLERSIPWSETAFRVSPPIAPVHPEPPKAVVALSSGRQPGDRDVYLPSIRAPKGQKHVHPNTNGGVGAPRARVQRTVARDRRWVGRPREVRAGFITSARSEGVAGPSAAAEAPFECVETSSW